MTDEEMKGVSAQALNLAKHDAQHGGFNFLFGAVHAGEGLHRMTQVEKAIIERLGDDWLNHGRTKDIGFTMLRLGAKLTYKHEATALVFGCAANLFGPTAKFAALPPEKQQEMVDHHGGHEEHHRLAKEGWFEVRDGLTVVVQTRERVCCASLVIGEERTDFQFFSQEEFGGRMKLYGDEMAEELIAQIKQMARRVY